MKVIRCVGTSCCELEIDFTRPVRLWERVSITGASALCIPVTGNDNFSEVYFWDNENATAIIGNDRYELTKGNPKVFAQLKNNVELLFALKALK